MHLVRGKPVNYLVRVAIAKRFDHVISNPCYWRRRGRVVKGTGLVIQWSRVQALNPATHWFCSFCPRFNSSFVYFGPEKPLWGSAQYFNLICHMTALVIRLGAVYNLVT